MGRKNPSLQHELIKRVLPQIENNLTGTAYKKHIKKFASWARENGYRKLEDITKETIQEYEKHLENAPKKYTPATIHTYLIYSGDYSHISFPSLFGCGYTNGRN